ncbi:MAG: hypothetical protein Q9159_007545 [Coniocarpon cinnabarinum]
MGYSATEALFKEHRDAVDGVQEKIEKFWERKKPFRVFHGSTNQTRPTSFSRSDIVDVSHLDHVLYVDPESQTCLVEPNVDMWSLVNATLEEDMLPPVVPEFPAITVGGAFNGTAGESSSWRNGFFDRNVLYVQIILADGRIVHCGRDGVVKVPPLVFGDNSNEDSPEMEEENEEKLTEMGGGADRELSNDELKELFFASIGSFGTIGVTTLFCLSLDKVEEGSHVLLHYQPVISASDAVSVIQRKIEEVNSGAFEKSGNGDEAPDFIDGILFNAEHGVIMTGRIVPPDEVNHLKWHEKIWQRSFARPWNRWFYLHAEQRLKQATKKHHANKIVTPSADLIPIRQYLFRYDVSAFWMGKEAMALLKWPYNRITRMITYPFIGTRTLYSAMHLSGAAGKYIIQDFIMPADKPQQGGEKRKTIQAPAQADYQQPLSEKANVEQPDQPKPAGRKSTWKKLGRKSTQAKMPADAPGKSSSAPAQKASKASTGGDGIILDRELDDELAALDSKTNLAQGLGINFEDESSFTAAGNPSMQVDIPRETAEQIGSSMNTPNQQVFSDQRAGQPSTSIDTQSNTLTTAQLQSDDTLKRPSEAKAPEPRNDQQSTSPSNANDASTASNQTTTTSQESQQHASADSQQPFLQSQTEQPTTSTPPRNASQQTTLANSTTDSPPCLVEKDANNNGNEDDDDDDDDDPEESPATRMINYINENMGIYPLWLCPILGNSPALMHQHAPALRSTEPELLEDLKLTRTVINIGTWGPPSPPKLRRVGLNDPSSRGYDPSSKESRANWIADNRKLEAKCTKLGGKKWLYAQLFYPNEDDFWGGIGVVRWVWEEVRERFGAGMLPSLWEKIGFKEELNDTWATELGVSFDLM